MTSVTEAPGPRLRVMWISTIAFTVMFNVWLMLGVLGIPIRTELRLTVAPAGGYLNGLIPGGWRFIPVVYAVMLLVTALATWWLSPVPDRMPGKGRPMMDMLAPLRYLRVWRLSLYYIVVFGAYVAFSGWLPKYYIDTYGMSLPTAALLTASFIFPASLLRPLGGYLSDLYGPRVVTYAVFVAMTLSLLVLSIPNGEYFAT